MAEYQAMFAAPPPMNHLVGPDRDPYRTLISLVDCHDLVIEADGAVLELHGLIQPLELVDCTGATLRGLTIAWDRDLAGLRAQRCYNYRPAVFLYRSRGIALRDVTIHAAVGMGLLAQRCADIDVERLRVEPAPGHRLSTITDATHFACCAGAIAVRGSSFAGMGDDAINVHGFYLTVTAIPARDRFTAELRSAHPQAMVFPVPDDGAAVEYVRPDTLLPFAGGRIGWVAEIEVPEGVPDGLAPGDLVADLGAVAALRFTGNRVRGIRARGALVQTRDAEIADNRIERCTGTAIVVDTALGWAESIGTRGVRIVRNRILACGGGAGTYERTCGVAVLSECPTPAVGVHRDLVIADNDIAGDGSLAAISVRCARGVRIAGNRANGVARLLDLDQVEDVAVAGNRLVAADALPWIHAPDA